LDRSWLPSYTLAETVARDYVRFLRGEMTGETILFSPARFRLWIDYFSNAHGLYSVNNRLAAIAVEEWLPSPAPVIQELGGGRARAWSSGAGTRAPPARSSSGSTKRAVSAQSGSIASRSSCPRFSGAGSRHSSRGSPVCPRSSSPSST